MVIMGQNGTVETHRTIGQKLTRLGLGIIKLAAGISLTVGLLAVLPNLILAFFALLGALWFAKNSANMLAAVVSNVSYIAAKSVAAFWRSL